MHKCTDTGLGGAIIPGSLCASLFPAIIGTAFPGALYLSQTLKFRNPALVSLRPVCDAEHCRAVASTSRCKLGDCPLCYAVSITSELRTPVLFQPPTLGHCRSALLFAPK